MARFWQWMLEKITGGASPEEKLDRAAEQMQKEVQLHRDLAARTVALARSKQRELREVVGRYRQLEAAAIALQQEGKGEAVGFLAVEMANLKGQMEAMTQDAEQLNVSSGEAVTQYRQEKEEAARLLQQHGQAKAVAQMNREFKNLQQEMRALTGAATAKGAYRAVLQEIGTRAHEFRAYAELESGDSGRRAEVARALEGIEVKGVLQDIRTKALGAGEPVTDVQIIYRAQAALESDPIRGALPASTEQEGEGEGEG